jgi:hypothetical protein
MLGYLVFVSGWSLISCYYNDMGIYNLELFRYTEPSFATARLAVFWLVFMAGFSFMARLIGDRPLARHDYHIALRDVNWGSVKLAAYGGIVLLVAYIVYTLSIGGIPLLSGLGRHEYFVQAGPLERTLLVFAPMIAFLCGYHRPRHGRLPMGSILWAVLLVYVVLIGNKFSFLLILTVAFLIPVVVRRLEWDPSFRLITVKRVAVFGLVALALITYAFGSYLRSQGDRELAFSYLYNVCWRFRERCGGPSTTTSGRKGATIATTGR